MALTDFYLRALLKPGENTSGAALRGLGYESTEQTPHGFRAMFRTIAAEDLEIRIDWLELQLAHEVKDAKGRAYKRASFRRAATTERRCAILRGYRDNRNDA